MCESEKDRVLRWWREVGFDTAVAAHERAAVAGLEPFHDPEIQQKSRPRRGGVPAVISTPDREERDMDGDS